MFLQLSVRLGVCIRRIANAASSHELIVALCTDAQPVLLVSCLHAGQLTMHAKVQRAMLTLRQPHMRAFYERTVSQDHGTVQFDHREFWAAWYKENTKPREWYIQKYAALRPVLRQHCRHSDRVLHVGVGTSTLQEDMAADGYQHIVNVDYSAECIALMEQRWEDRCRFLRWALR